MAVAMAMHEKGTTDSEGILFLSLLTRILRSSPLFCSHNAPCGRKAGHRTRTRGRALGHLSTQRIENWPCDGSSGCDSNSSLFFRVRVSARGLAPSGVFEPSSRCLAQAAQPHAPHQVGLACHLYRARPWSLDRHIR